MRKKIMCLTATVITILGLCVGCGNKDIWDTNYTYDWAIIRLQNDEVVEGKVDKWTDYEDGDQLQVTVNGETYLVHSMNITLINK